MDTCFGNKKTCFINMNALANNKSVANKTSVIVGGKFNCALEGPCDAKSPVAWPRTPWSTRALQLVVTLRRLVDGWTHIHGHNYVPTCKRGNTSLHLESFYLPSALVQYFRACKVLNPFTTGPWFLSPSSGHYHQRAGRSYFPIGAEIYRLHHS